MAVWDQDGSPSVIDIDAALLEHVRGTGTATLTRNPGNVSTVAAPLVSNRRVAGVLYLAGGAMQDSHLQFAAAIGTIVGPVFDDALRFERLRDENRQLRVDVQTDHGMVGDSAAAREIYRFIARVSPTTATVLLLGESGTGKELAARAIHRNSARSACPFVAINCAALTETLLESELFGHERGAFTGAVTQKKGKLECADGGTLFLDEVAELPLQLQAKLLRVLQEREFERVGGTRPIRVDIRLVAATNRDVRAAVSEGRFREDLYYRLNVVSFVLPPLRERLDDVPLLASHFLEKVRTRCGTEVTGISERALACLAEYSWPGNIRELQNAIERAVVFGTTAAILPEDLPEAILETASLESMPEGSYERRLKQEKCDLVARTIVDCGGNFTEAARRLSLHPNSLHRIVRNLGIRDEIVRRLSSKPARASS